MKFTDLIYTRIVTSFLSFPSINSWLITFILLLIISLICLPIGFKTGFLRCKNQSLSLRIFISVPITCFFFPALAEELFFRVMLLPCKTENASITIQLIWGSVSLLAYVLSHPLNAVTLYKKGFTTFTNPVFLLSASFLGIACSIAYLESGSIWTAVTIHWITVIAWLLFLGGYSKLNYS